MLNATYKENVKDYALAHTLCFFGRSQFHGRFSRETTPRRRNRQLEKMFDNSLLQEIQKESATTK